MSEQDSNRLSPTRSLSSSSRTSSSSLVSMEDPWSTNSSRPTSLGSSHDLNQPNEVDKLSKFPSRYPLVTDHSEGSTLSNSATPSYPFPSSSPSPNRPYTLERLHSNSALTDLASIVDRTPSGLSTPRAYSFESLTPGLSSQIQQRSASFSHFSLPNQTSYLLRERRISDSMRVADDMSSMYARSTSSMGSGSSGSCSVHMPATPPTIPFLPTLGDAPGCSIDVDDSDPLEVKVTATLPGFKLENITVALKRNGSLHIIADRFDSDTKPITKSRPSTAPSSLGHSTEGHHFERMIELNGVAGRERTSAQFDGTTLIVRVDRKTQREKEFWDCKPLESH